MKIESATPEVATYVKQVIACQMAKKLTESGTDLTDDTAVVAVLSKSNFGSQSIAMLMGEAVSLARCSCRFVVTGVVAFGLFFGAVDERREFKVSAYGNYNRQAVSFQYSNLYMAVSVTGQ